jgi:hypothetical protein
MYNNLAEAINTVEEGMYGKWYTEVVGLRRQYIYVYI